MMIYQCDLCHWQGMLEERDWRRCPQCATGDEHLIMVPGPASKTREDVAELKRAWLRDPWDNLAETPGFEAFWGELHAFEDEHTHQRRENERALQGRIARIADLPVSGLTYRQWLVEQALMGMVAGDSTPEGVGEAVLRAVDALLRAMAREGAEHG